MMTLLIFIAVLGILVFVHELGHFFTARLLGVKSEEFGFGFPPRICGWRKVNGKRKFFWGNQDIEKIESEDTVWSLNWLPLGGFVKIKGENGDGEDADSFGVQKAWKRIIILSAGVTMNFLLAMVLLSAVYMIGSPQAVTGEGSAAQVTDAQVQIMAVTADSPAEIAGLEIGDAIVSIDGESVEETDEVSKLIVDKASQDVLLVINRSGEEQDITVVPELNEESETGVIGVSLIKAGLVKYPWYQAIWLGIKSTFLMTWQILIGFGVLIKGLFVGLPAGVDVAGPVGIAVMTGQVAKLGVVYLLQFSALLSINLAIINFLPLPALDGGRVLFVLIEKVRGKPVDRKLEGIIHTFGFLFLILLIFVVTGRDIWKFKQAFIDFFQHLIG